MNIIYANLIDLMGLINGITLGDSKFNESVFCLNFCVYDARARILIHYVSEASNTNLNVYATKHPGEIEPDLDPDSELIYEFRSKQSGDILDQACWLGAHLTWAMFKMGVIGADKEQEFCKIFGAVIKSA